MEPKNGVPTKTVMHATDTVLSRAVAAISETLLQQVTEILKRVFKFHYESAKEIGQSPEWQEMNNLLFVAVDNYVGIAMSNRRKVHGDPFLWVKEKIEANESAILMHHFGCNPQIGLPWRERFRSQQRRGFVERHCSGSTRKAGRGRCSSLTW